MNTDPHSARKFDVLVAGELNIDLIFNKIEKFPETGKEVLAEFMALRLGSSSAIFASNLRSMGSLVAFTGMTGQDVFGNFVARELEDRNVDTRYIFKVPGASTGATVVMTQGEDRANLTYPGAMSEFSSDDVTQNMLFSAAHLHVSSVFLQPRLKKGIVSLMRRAKGLGLTTSLDPQWDPAEKWDLPLKELLPLVDVFLPNMQEFLNISHSSSLQEGTGKLANLVNNLVVKDGRNGAYLFNGTDIIHQPAFLNDNVADCTGAGDSFDAGFIHRYIRNESLDECLRFAALMGAVNTTEAGGTAAFRDMESIRKIALERFKCEI
jgi:sugar/nucleoside kinase (ribokinase family)